MIRQEAIGRFRRDRHPLVIWGIDRAFAGTKPTDPGLPVVMLLSEIGRLAPHDPPDETPRTRLLWRIEDLVWGSDFLDPPVGHEGDTV